MKTLKAVAKWTLVAILAAMALLDLSFLTGWFMADVSNLSLVLNDDDDE